MAAVAAAAAQSAETPAALEAEAAADADGISVDAAAGGGSYSAEGASCSSNGCSIPLQQLQQQVQDAGALTTARPDLDAQLTQEQTPPASQAGSRAPRETLSAISMQGNVSAGLPQTPTCASPMLAPPAAGSIILTTAADSAASTLVPMPAATAHACVTSPAPRQHAAAEAAIVGMCGGRSSPAPLPIAAAVDAATRELAREIGVMQRLNHPHVTKLFEVRNKQLNGGGGSDDGQQDIFGAAQHHLQHCTLAAWGIAACAEVSNQVAAAPVAVHVLFRPNLLLQQPTGHP